MTMQLDAERRIVKSLKTLPSTTLKQRLKISHSQPPGYGPKAQTGIRPEQARDTPPSESTRTPAPADTTYSEKWVEPFNSAKNQISFRPPHSKSTIFVIFSFTPLFCSDLLYLKEPLFRVFS